MSIFNKVQKQIRKILKLANDIDIENIKVE